MTPDQIRQKYLRVIRRPGVTEETVHGFLAQYPALLPVLWPYDNLVFSKLPLGSQYVVDFAFARENTGGVTWHLLEIERPGDSIFSRAGDPAARLVHGMRQLADWTAWFRDNRDYVRRHFPFGSKMAELGLTDPECILIIGRRAAVADRDRARYDQLSRGAHVRVITFDRLSDNLVWPALDDRSGPLRMARFIKGDIRAHEVIQRMTMDIQWHVEAPGGRKSGGSGSHRGRSATPKRR